MCYWVGTNLVHTDDCECDIEEINHREDHEHPDEVGHVGEATGW